MLNFPAAGTYLLETAGKGFSIFSSIIFSTVSLKEDFLAARRFYFQMMAARSASLKTSDFWNNSRLFIF